MVFLRASFLFSYVYTWRQIKERKKEMARVWCGVACDPSYPKNMSAALGERELEPGPNVCVGWVEGVPQHVVCVPDVLQRGGEEGGGSKGARTAEGQRVEGSKTTRGAEVHKGRETHGHTGARKAGPQEGQRRGADGACFPEIRHSCALCFRALGWDEATNVSFCLRRPGNGALARDQVRGHRRQTFVAPRPKQSRQGRGW